MPLRPGPPNHPPREVIDRLIDLVAEAKVCLLVAAATAPGSPEREGQLEKLKGAVVAPRHLVDEILGRAQALPREVLVELRACELAISRLEAGAVPRPSPPRGETP